jgi:DNA-binding MarR family transcriptional regulator
MGSTFGREINSLIKAVDAIRTQSIDMPAQQILTFLTVAMRPGITMEDLGRDVGISQSSVSRNVAALSKQHRLGKPGADYLEAIEDPRERRRKVMYLTPKGRSVMRKALEALTGEPVDFESPTAKEAWSR